MSTDERVAQLEAALATANAKLVKAEKRARAAEKQKGGRGAAGRRANQGSADAGASGDAGSDFAPERRRLEARIAELERDVKAEKLNHDMISQTLESLHRELQEAGIELQKTGAQFEFDADEAARALALDPEDGIGADGLEAARRAAERVQAGEGGGAHISGLDMPSSLGSLGAGPQTNAKSLIASLKEQLEKERKENVRNMEQSRQWNASLGDTAGEVTASLREQIAQQNADLAARDKTIELLKEELERTLAASVSGAAPAADTTGSQVDAEELARAEQRLKRAEKQLEVTREEAQNEALRQERALSDLQAALESEQARSTDLGEQLRAASTRCTDLDAQLQSQLEATRQSGGAAEQQQTAHAAEVSSLRAEIVTLKGDMERLREAAENDAAKHRQREAELEQEKLELELSTIDTLKDHISELRGMWEGDEPVTA